jgi:hypothetical protein
MISCYERDKSKDIPVTGRGGHGGWEMLRIPRYERGTKWKYCVWPAFVMSFSDCVINNDVIWANLSTASVMHFSRSENNPGKQKLWVLIWIRGAYIELIDCDLRWCHVVCNISWYISTDLWRNVFGRSKVAHEVKLAFCYCSIQFKVWFLSCSEILSYIAVS